MLPTELRSTQRTSHKCRVWPTRQCQLRSTQHCSGILVTDSYMNVDVSDVTKVHATLQHSCLKLLSLTHMASTSTATHWRATLYTFFCCWCTPTMLTLLWRWPQPYPADTPTIADIRLWHFPHLSFTTGIVSNQNRYEAHATIMNMTNIHTARHKWSGARTKNITILSLMYTMTLDWPYNQCEWLIM